jgi:hypothetical protein
MRTVGARNLAQIAPRAFDLAVVGRSGDDPLHPNPKEERSVARPIERIAHRLFTRQVRQHDVEPSLSNRLWADREIRAFWLTHAQDVFEDVRAECAANLRAHPGDR